MPISVRSILNDPKNGLEDKFDPTWDYALCGDGDSTCQRKLEKGYVVLLSDIEGSGREKMVLMGRKRDN